MGLSPRDKTNILVDVLVGDWIGKNDLFRVPEGSTFRLYAWRPGSDDVKIIAAVDDESAARIAVQARIDHCEQTEAEALEHVTTRDSLRRIDPDALFQGEAPLWDGLRDVGDSVPKP